MQDSLNAVNEFKVYKNKLRCSSFYIEFNNKLDTSASISFLDGNEGECIVEISSEISLPENKLSTRFYSMRYNTTTDALEIEINKHTLFIMCD